MDEIVQEIVRKVEAFDVFGPEPGFKFTEIFFRQNGQLYRTTSENRFPKDSDIPIFDITSKDVHLLPLKAYQAEWLDGITTYNVLDDSLPPDVFLKTISLTSYDPTDVCGMTSRVHPEVKILERIKADKERRHHDDTIGENIVEYYGCVRSSDGVFITGIVLKRYPYTLWDIAEAKNKQLADSENDVNLVSADPANVAQCTLPTEPEKVIEGLIKGLQYLHGLGLIHSDINPTNIMFDNDGRLIIIDFDFCADKGEDVSGGTFGWMDEPGSWTTAVEDVDIRALCRVAIFIHQNFTLDKLDLPPDYDGVEDDFALIKEWISERVDCAKPWLSKEGNKTADPL